MTTETLREYKAMYERADAVLAAKDAAYFKQIGRDNAADEAAAEAGLSGKEAVAFAAGFSGVPAKFYDPRGRGLESIFRAGRLAHGTKEGQRAVRAATAVMYASNVSATTHNISHECA